MLTGELPCPCDRSCFHYQLSLKYKVNGYTVGKQLLFALLPPFQCQSGVSFIEKNILLNSLRVNPFLKDFINSTAIRKAKIIYNFGLSECSRVNQGSKWNVT